MTNNEVWKAVLGYDGMYEVSDHGRVRSWHRGQRDRRKEPRILRQSVVNGYPALGLRKNGQDKMLKVHALVLTAFVGPRPLGLVCCHGDGSRTNNHLSNLRWDTSSANRQDAIEHGTVVVYRGEANRWAKLTEEQVTEIRHLYAAGGVTQCELAARFGVAQASVGRAIHRKTWAHLDDGITFDGNAPLANYHASRARGEANGRAKLTEEQVTKIRRLYSADGVTHRELGARFGMGKTSVGRIINRKTWTHVA